MAEYNYVGDGSPDGTIVVKSATEKLGFYGVTPVVQQAVLAAVTTTTATTTAFGFQTSAQFNALIAAVNTLISNQKTYGLMATA